MIETFFSRTEMLLGIDNIEKLRNSKVIVFGVGAVGSYAVEALARLGVGHMTLVDFDKVAVSNLNRQLVALNSTLGKFKVDIAKERIKDINPDCQVIKQQVFAEAENIPELLEKGFDVIVDAIDVLTSKADLLEYAVKHDIKVISSMGAGVKTSPYALMCADISKTNTCRLARSLRRILRERGVKKGIKCVFSRQPSVNLEGAQKNPPRTSDSQGAKTKAPVGTISYMTGIVGLTVAAEAVNLLLGEDVDLGF